MCQWWVLQVHNARNLLCCLYIVYISDAPVTVPLLDVIYIQWLAIGGLQPASSDQRRPLTSPMHVQAMDALGDVHTLRRACRMHVPLVLGALEELREAEGRDAGATGELSQGSADSADGPPRGPPEAGLDLPEVPHSRCYAASHI